jgi:WD40 repeat protein
LHRPRSRRVQFGGRVTHRLPLGAGLSGFGKMEWAGPALQPRRQVRSLPHADEVMSVASSPDGALLASGCYDSQVYLWGIP